MTDLLRDQARSDGARAAAAGGALVDVPYQVGTRAWHDWRGGFIAARLEA